jgi:hypothetical protein
MPGPGYSGTPLAQKLGIKPGHVVALLDAPPAFKDMLEGLPEDVTFVTSATKRRGFNVALAFVTTRAALERRIADSLSVMPTDAAVWVCWPKKSSGVATDVTEQTIRDVALPQGLVDVKVCAVTDVWSGLRLVIRKELRTPKAPRKPIKPLSTPKTGLKKAP